ncbi:MAG: P1 family peptidase [Deltaproteobacteria bacterium]|nr:P1 family peptidase [Deltaproteobacteria bacterium]
MPPAWARTPSRRRRARDLGVPFAGVPGTYNAITDVDGVAVGYRTIIRGDGPLVVGQGPVRTGVTAIHPRGLSGIGVPVMAGVHSLNGNGEMTGWAWIEECGRTEMPLLLTNTHAVGVAHDAVIRWMQQQRPTTAPLWCLPVVAETFDGKLNDINGFHVTTADVTAALEAATAGPLDEGSVGGGTGMVCYEFKGGSGTASRRVVVGEGPGFEGHRGHEGTVGVFVQANFGRRPLLTVAGAPIGRWLAEQEERAGGKDGIELPEQGSIIVVVATDLPLLPHQLKRLARRAGLGVGRSGGIGGHGSGDLFLAFSTGNAVFFGPGGGPRALLAVPDDALSPVFTAVVQATDEAILNALVANEAMVGCDGHRVPALPHDVVERWMRHMTRGPG